MLKKNRAKFQYLKSKRVIFDDQWQKLFPSSGDPPDSKTFDITLLHLLIREVCYLPVPLTGWHKMPAEDDESLEANVTRIKCFTNELCDSVSTGISNYEFEDKWNKIASSLEAIKISVYRQKIQGLKNDHIDDGTRQLVEDQVEQWQKLQQKDEFEPISQLGSYVPDMLPQERMFGRSQELQQVREHVESGTFSVVLITGGPGFGKTTLAKEVARDLAKPENGKTVLFCRLLSKKTFNAVATEMIHSCGKIYTQLPKRPDQWLKDWSKHIQKPVTFVLDNADGVLESEEKTPFLRILSEMRKLSQKKVTFVITSRKQFKDADLPSKDVRLSPLSSEQAQKVLVSRVNVEEIRKKLSKTKAIVELCGYVPLALCIVGSLLSDYTEEKVIASLEKEQMIVLDDDNESVQAAIKTSFDLLTKVEQNALILMSMFPGSFYCDAAEVVIKACSDPKRTLPVSTLRSLKNRSLVEQPCSRRYQLHPLIRAFAKKIDQANNFRLLVKGKQLACAYFMSRLDQNAKLYWSKDTCKAAIVSFSEDRQNFEYFLQVYAKGMKNHDEEIVGSCKTFQQDFLQKCMYLEKCVPPRFYTQILKMLLKSFSEPEIQPVRAVELMCLLGHEERKLGDNASYKHYMEKANQFYSEKKADFAANALSEVFFLNSYTDFLSMKGDPASSEHIQELSYIDLKLCDEELEEDHPKRAETYLLAGRFAKRYQDRPEAHRRFQEALNVFQKHLGKHLMIVHALEETGDFFFAGETEDNFDKALTRYEEALNMMKQLGMENNKESINILKNLGICTMKKGNYHKAVE